MADVTLDAHWQDGLSAPYTRTMQTVVTQSKRAEKATEELERESKSMETQAKRNDAAMDAAARSLKEYARDFGPAIRVSDQFTDKIEAMARESGLAEDAASDFADEISFLTDKGEDLDKVMDKARVSLERVRREQRKGERATKRQAKAFGALRTKVLAATAAFVGSLAIAEGLRRGVGTSIALSLAHEQSLVKIGFALRNSNEDFRGAAKLQDQWAESVQDATGASSDQILEFQAIALNMGANLQLSRLMVIAAQNLSTATGKQLSESFLQLSKSLGGYAGELSEVLPAVKALTREQLLAGEAAVLAEKQYAGAAEEVAKTRQGLIDKFKANAGDLGGSFGDFLTVGDEESIIARMDKVVSVTEQSVLKINRALEQIQSEGGNIGFLQAALLLEQFSPLPPGSGPRAGLVARGGALLEQDQQQLRRSGPIHDPLILGIPQSTMDAAVEGQLDYLESLIKLDQQVVDLEKSGRSLQSIFQALVEAFPPDEAARIAKTIFGTGDSTSAAAIAQREIERSARDAAIRASIDAELRAVARGGFPRGIRGLPEDQQRAVDERDRAGADERRRAFADAILASRGLEDSAIDRAERKRLEFQRNLEDTFPKVLEDLQRLDRAFGRAFADWVLEAESMSEAIKEILRGIASSFLEDAATKFGSSILGSIVDFGLSLLPGAAVAAATASQGGDGSGSGGVPTGEGTTALGTDIAHAVERLRETIEDNRDDISADVAVRAVARVLLPELRNARGR